MTGSTAWVRQHVHCGVCGGSLQDSPTVNFKLIDRRPTWAEPLALNAATGNDHALAVTCTGCVFAEEPAIREAVEFHDPSPDDPFSVPEVRYHPVQDLEELPRYLAGPEARCRVCGCTDDDCLDCILRTGEPCSWAEADLCSACVGDLTREERL